MRDIFDLDVELEMVGWREAFRRIDSGEADFYGPIAISEERRQKYIVVEPLFCSYGKLFSHVDNPIQFEEYKGNDPRIDDVELITFKP